MREGGGVERYNLKLRGGSRPCAYPPSEDEGEGVAVGRRAAGRGARGPSPRGRAAPAVPGNTSGFNGDESDAQRSRELDPRLHDDETDNPGDGCGFSLEEGARPGAERAVEGASGRTLSLSKWGDIF